MNINDIIPGKTYRPINQSGKPTSFDKKVLKIVPVEGEMRESWIIWRYTDEVGDLCSTLDDFAAHHELIEEKITVVFRTPTHGDSWISALSGEIIHSVPNGSGPFSDEKRWVVVK